MPTLRSSPSSPSPIRVLVVDDEEEILELLGEYLKARGFAVATAYDGADAMAALHAEDLDLVITDMKMSQADGLELLAATRALRRPVGVILMTGYGTVETATHALTHGAYAYLLKPFKLRDLHNVVKGALVRLESERDAQSLPHLVEFYEGVHGAKGPDDLPRLQGLLATVALAETHSHEVAVWLKGPGGWEAVARGGHADALSSVDPQDPGLDDANICAAPLYQKGQRVGTLAVAGPRQSEDASARLTRLAAAFSHALDRAAPQA